MRGLPAVVHREQMLVDLAVGVVVEVAGAQDQGDFVKDLRQQQDLPSTARSASTVLR